VVAKQNSQSEDDFLKMQQEAVRRVREMQSRARATLENAGMHIENNSESEFPSAQADNGRKTNDVTFRASSPDLYFNEPVTNIPYSVEPHTNATNLHDSHTNAPHQSQRPENINPLSRDEPSRIHMSGLNLTLDSDQLLLLLTLYLLVKDGADKWLILSLAYVMLT
jgi:hypothetical protein